MKDTCDEIDIEPASLQESVGIGMASMFGGFVPALLLSFATGSSSWPLGVFWALIPLVAIIFTFYAQECETAMRWARNGGFLLLTALLGGLLVQDLVLFKALEVWAVCFLVTIGAIKGSNAPNEFRLVMGVGIAFILGLFTGY